MSVALQLFENLNDTHDERERNRLIVHAFEQLEERYPQLSHVATRADLSETELRLQLQIKQVEGEIKQAEGRLKLEIEGVRKDLKQIEVNLQQAMAAQTRWLIGGLAALGALFKLIG